MQTVVLNFPVDLEGMEIETEMAMVIVEDEETMEEQIPTIHLSKQKSVNSAHVLQQITHQHSDKETASEHYS